jgi:hypothetical protein
MMLYNRDYTNGAATCITGIGDKGTIMKRNDGASAWTIPSGFCTDYSFTSTGRTAMTGFSDFATARTFMPVILPVELISFTAINKGQGNVQTQWETLTEKNVEKFIVERSIDGINFFSIGTQKVTKNSNIRKSYLLDDMNPKMGVNYYRLKTLDLDGKFSYSKIVAITITDVSVNNNLLNVYPNPTPKGNDINIAGIEKGESRIQIVNTLGQVLFDKIIKHEGGIISIPQNFATGMYYIKVFSEKNVYRTKVVLE